MRNIKLFICALVFFHLLFLPQLSTQPNAAQEQTQEQGREKEKELLFNVPNISISFDLQDANIKDVLKIFSIQSGLNFIAAESMKDRKITLYLDKVPLNVAMDKLFKANNLTYDLDKEANIIIIKDAAVPEIETITKVYPLKYQSVPSALLKKEMDGNLGGSVGDIVEALRVLLSSRGAIKEDKRTNSIIITDMPNRFPLIEQLIKNLDVPIPQLLIEAEILDVSKNVIDKIGFDFGTNSAGTAATNPLTLIFPHGLFKTGPQKIMFGAASDRDKEGGVTIGHTYAHLLDFLRTQTDTKYLARPRIFTLNNQTAEIKISTQETVGIKEEATGTTTGVKAYNAERVDTGVTLRVTPQANLETGEITMFIMPMIKSTSRSSFLIGNSGTAYYNDPEERTTKTVARVRDGESIIIGGLIRNEKSEAITKVPILGDIPLLGALFRHKNKDKDKQRELLVFITPRIIKDKVIDLAQAKKIEPLEREQGTVSGFNRQTAINIMLDNFERKR